jgi:5-formyltetrahydrofolate cyclo-ligase
MAVETSHDIGEKKRRIRERALANRRAQENKDELSRDIWNRATALPAYRQADTILFYVSMRTEVRTRNALALALDSGKKAVVPYCVEGELGLFRLEHISELQSGTWQILEPRRNLRSVPGKQVDASELDLIIVPGVAFDRQGGRMGHGKGYYDKLLAHVRPGTKLVALAFECQMFPRVPMQGHDVYMDMVVTEKAVYEGRGRRQA